MRSNVDALKHVVVNPSISLDQLFEELARVEQQEHRQSVIDQIIVKMRRRLGKLTGEVHQRF